MAKYIYPAVFTPEDGGMFSRKMKSARFQPPLPSMRLNLMEKSLQPISHAILPYTAASLIMLR